MTKQISLGVIGVGYWGSLLVKKFSSLPNTSVLMVADLNSKRLQEIKKSFPKIKTSTKYQDVLRDISIDGVVIATPVLTHYKIAKDALLAEKHIFVEKPLTKTLKQTKELLKIARKKNLIIMIDSIYLYHPAVQEIKKMIDSGKLGKIMFIQSVRLGLELFPKGVNVVWDLAPHDIALITHLLGKKPKKISLKKSSLVNKDTVDTAFINLEFSKNLIAQVMISWLSPAKVRHFAVGGTKGTIVFDETREDKLLFFDTKIDKSFGKHKIFQPDRIGKPVLFPDKEPLILVCQDFVNSIIGKREPLAGTELSVKVIEILEKIR